VEKALMALSSVQLVLYQCTNLAGKVWKMSYFSGYAKVVARKKKKINQTMAVATPPSAKIMLSVMSSSYQLKMKVVKPYLRASDAELSSKHQML
jgi:hypothetical protein